MNEQLSHKLTETAIETIKLLDLVLQAKSENITTALDNIQQAEAAVKTLQTNIEQLSSDIRKLYYIEHPKPVPKSP